MPIIKACIFDLDGVIVDTAKYHYLAWKRLANQLGFDLTKQQNEKLKGISRKGSLEILLKLGGMTADEATQQKLMDQKNKWYVEYISKMTPNEILPGSLNLLEALKKADIKTAIGSASKNTQMILKQIGLENTFDAVIDGNKVTQAKPNPEVFLRGAQELNVPPENCIVFEDALAGIEAAKNGGMHAVGVGNADVLIGADRVIQSLTEIKINHHNIEWGF